MRNWPALTLLVLSQLSFGQTNDCAPVRLDRDQGCLSGVPVTNQGQDPNCFTHAAALMMTGYLRGTRGSHAVVAPEKIWTEIQASLPDKKSQYLSAELGRTCSAIGIAKTTGTCDRQVLLNVLKPFSEKLYGDSSKFELKWSLLLRDLKTVSDENMDRVSKGDCSRLIDDLKNMGISDSSVSGIASVLIATKPTDEAQDLDQILKGVCQTRGGWEPGGSSQKPQCNKVDFKPAQNGSKELERPDVFKHKLHELLDQPLNQSFPIGIEYCSGILEHPGKSFIIDRKFGENVDYLNTPERSLNLGSGCGYHASVIIGREKKEDGKCYFLIQNSWGASCNYYADPSLCENGKIWVEENEISKNILRVSHF